MKSATLLYISGTYALAAEGRPTECQASLTDRQSYLSVIDGNEGCVS
jgi:hypothetical protein